MNDPRNTSTPDLTHILRNYHEYPEDVVKQAYDELEIRGVLQEVIDKLKNEVKDGRIGFRAEYPEVDEPYRDFNPTNPVTLRIGSTQQMVFEQKLLMEGIPFFRHEGLDVIVPLVNYYFNDRDRARADELEIETHEYVHTLPPEARNKTSKPALKAFFWILIFIGVFLLLTLAGRVF